MSDTVFDVVVIGGGSTGTAVARDCAMRGLRMVLVQE
jgi:glycerol-3-phosphate dehydrogenase